MTNKEIASKFNLLGKIMELHGENAFKTKSYTNAYLTIRKLPDDLADMVEPEISALSGIGKAISAKITELLSTGEIQTLNKYLDITPSGIIQMLGIKGFGPKKIAVIWKELEIETIGELLYAVNENRLVELKGFGQKTQAALKEQLEYYLESSDKIHFATAEKYAKDIIEKLNKVFPEAQHQITGQVARKNNIIDCISLITTSNDKSILEFVENDSIIEKYDDGMSIHNCTVEFLKVKPNEFHFELAKSSSDADFWETLNIEKDTYQNEAEVFTKNKFPYYIPEFREKENIPQKENYKSNIIEADMIKGCIHNHSVYSDGMNSIEEMIDAAADEGYEYFVLTDHSKSAFYANGLQEERLYKQLDEIRTVDQNNPDIKLFSGIESDILSNGDLDYSDEILGELDVVIASVHSNLKMDIDKATTRLVRAIENPFTSILGHPTGRLLLSRKGYPLDFQKIIDACAANDVAIELNANPLRLDMDWTWIHYALEKDVLISINPDAHSIAGIKDIYYGVCSARKAALPINSCLNAFDLEEFEEWLSEQHQKRG